MSFSSDFPQLKDNRIYFDSATRGLSPLPALNVLIDSLKEGYGAPHVGSHWLAQNTYRHIQSARVQISRFFQSSPNYTALFPSLDHAISIVLGSMSWQKGDIVLSTMNEHHSLLVPLLFLRKSRGIDLRLLPPDEEGSFIDWCDKEIPNAKMIAVSNATMVQAYQRDIFTMTEIAQEYNVLSLVDSSKTFGIWPFDSAGLNASLHLCSGIVSLLGPLQCAVGVFNSEFEESLDPIVLGSKVVQEVSLDNYFLSAPPERLEPGGVPLGALIGLAGSLDYLTGISRNKIRNHVEHLVNFAVESLSEVPLIHVVGHEIENSLSESAVPSGIVSIRIEGFHSHEVCILLQDMKKIAARSGFMCSQLLFLNKNIGSVVQFSFHIYNTIDEIVVLLDVLRSILS